jgi:hypothetical protein
VADRPTDARTRPGHQRDLATDPIHELTP